MNAIKAQHAYGLPELPACIIVDGPQEADADGTPEWTVCFADNDGEPINAKNAIWFCQTRESALSLGIALSNRYHLELINESIHA